MSTLKTNNIANVAGTATTDVLNVINGSAKAWVNFNGTGTVAIRKSYNVSSITDLGAGYYRANFGTALPDANFATTIGASNNAVVDSSWPVPKILAQTTGAVDISTPTFSNSGIDCVYIAVSCFG